MLRTLAAFSANDAKSIRRDSLLLGILIMPWLMALFLRLLVPGVSAWTASRFGLDLTTYYPLIVAFFLFLNIPLLFGVLSGFMLLDERDDDTLTALRVTPASLQGFTFYRLLTGFTLSVLYILVTTPLTGLLSLADTLRAVPAAFLASLFTPLTAMLLGAFASNKVEGFAVMKGFGLLMVGPLMAYFVPGAWEALFGILPTYWPAKVFWASVADEPYLWQWLVGLVYNAVLITWLTRRFYAQVYR